MVLSNFAKKVIYISSVITAAVTIIGTLGWIYNEYQDYKRKTENQLDNRINELIENHGNTILHEIHQRTELFNTSIDSLQNQINNLIESNSYFAIGLRGDGTGNMWYRDLYGKIYRVYYYRDIERYYYINDDGLAIYL